MKALEQTRTARGAIVPAMYDSPSGLGNVMLGLSLFQILLFHFSVMFMFMFIFIFNLIL